MKYLICLLSLLPLLLACGDSGENPDGNKNNFSFEGRIAGAGNQKIKILGSTDRGQFTLAETTADANGSFKMESYVPGLGIYSLQVGNDEHNAVIVPIDENDAAIVNGDIQTIGFLPKFSGTNWARPLTEYMSLFNDFATKQMEQLPEIKDQGAMVAKFTELRKPIDAFVRKNILQDPGNPANMVFSSLLVPSPELGFNSYNPENIGLLKRIEKAYRKQHADSPMTAALSTQIAQIESAYENYVRNFSGTLAAPEIVANTPDGDELRLSSLKGKVVLVDFWASWCMPCRKENPNVVNMYKKYHSQGLEVFSFSLDHDKNAWKEAIEKDGLIWKTHASDLLGWQTPMVAAYQFSGIPHSVVVNREGNIVAVGLRGSELEQKLVEELHKK